jgi:hypothetical protein
MIKYFELLLDLLDIEKSIRPDYIKIANDIEFKLEGSKTLSNLQVYHRHAFVFE